MIGGTCCVRCSSFVNIKVLFGGRERESNNVRKQRSQQRFLPLIPGTGSWTRRSTEAPPSCWGGCWISSQLPAEFREALLLLHVGQNQLRRSGRTLHVDPELPGGIPGLIWPGNASDRPGGARNPRWFLTDRTINTWRCYGHVTLTKDALPSRRLGALL